jgi:succinyl-diaminopimelate desuccinylase
MGSPTLNIGMVSGGLNINSVPDAADFTLDIRTVPGMSHAHIHDQLTFTIPAAELTTLVDLPSVWSDPADPTMQKLGAAYRSATGRDTPPTSAAYFTDASILTPALGDVPTIICGPGDPAMAHKIDEYCEVAAIHEAVEIYRAILRLT